MTEYTARSRSVTDTQPEGHSRTHIWFIADRHRRLRHPTIGCVAPTPEQPGARHDASPSAAQMADACAVSQAGVISGAGSDSS